jgi:hypothetical protein
VVAGGPLGNAPAPHDVDGHPAMAPHSARTLEAINLDGITLFSLATVPITRYRYRGNSIPSPWPDALAGPAPTA